MMRTADMWRSTRKEHIVLYLVGGSDPSDPTPGELLKCYKAEDIEFKDWIEKKNIKLVGGLEFVRGGLEIGWLYG